jgi:hypothetical protein
MKLYRTAVLRHDGTSWSAIAAGASKDLRGVWASSASDVWAVGMAGSIVHFDGSSWSPTTPLSGSLLGAVNGASASNVWAVGQSLTILRFGPSPP